jgi:hypothetical protein
MVGHKLGQKVLETQMTVLDNPSEDVAAFLNNKKDSSSPEDFERDNDMDEMRECELNKLEAHLG